MTHPTFDVEDILLSACAGGQSTWVSCPYAVGVPEIFKSLGGKWDKFANAWAIPNTELADLRKRLPKIVDAVRIQQAIDLADGKTPRPVSRPNIRAAGPALPESVIGDDWIAMGVLDDGEESAAARALGCARKSTIFKRFWFAPNQDVADELMAALKPIREDAELRAARQLERAALARQQAVVERERAEDLTTAIRAVFADRFRGPRDIRDLEALAEIAAAWRTARFIKLSSRLLDGRGTTSVQITTPSGRKVSFTSMTKTERTQISRRVELVEIRAPVFPDGAGFVTRVTTSANGKADTRNLKPYVVEVATL